MKVISYFLAATLTFFLLLSSFSKTVNASNPSFSVQFLSATVSGGSYTYSDFANTSPGGEVTFYIELKNTSPGSTSSNTLIKLSLPDNYSSSANPTVNVTNSNGSSASDGTTVNFSSSSKLNLKSNTTELTWDRDGDGSKEFNGSKVGDSITSSGINIGDLQGGDSYVVQIITKVSVEGGSGSSSTSSNSSTPTPSPKQDSCQDSKPGKVTKVSVKRESPSSVKVEWEKASSANNYNLVYGLSSGNYTYGVNNLGDVTSTQVNYLDPNANYYFAVLAINGCMPGELSAEASTLQQKITSASPSPNKTSGEVKAAAIVSPPSPKPTPAQSESTTVKTGDLLKEDKAQSLGWKLAKLTLPIVLVTALFSLLFYVNNQISSAPFIEKLDLNTKKVNGKKSKLKDKLLHWWVA